MGILYDHMCKNIIEELHNLNVFAARSGESLESLDIGELKHELSIAQAMNE